ncbi:hypothetical protein CO230_06830 [Chryseobacterium sp. 6424]|uniref:DUF962 domain-containing protein n=1 Tax=Chryseobacterium sp. 6424 TaxID=2039166 RepID=UPI000EFBAA9E|nr:DUF962 domain-containing protein [Chryseobacterium sp. 6424]AYO57863.1 hypothetical protein CO230_06830 [Chryseobacterium sp. 6424]
MSERIKTYQEFYIYYLSQHQKTATKILHFIGIMIVLGVVAYVLASGKERFLWYIAIVGYGLPLLSHYTFERNTPTAFRYPLWTFISDFKMFFELIFGKTKFKNNA